MSGVANDALYDLWKFTLANYDWSDDFEVLLPQHQFDVVDEWLRRDKVQSDGGTELKRQVQYNEGDATWARPAAVRTRAVQRVVTELKAPWVGIYAEYDMIAAEMRRNLGRSKLKSLAKSRRISAMIGLAKQLDARAWQTPDDSADDLHPYGVPYWIVPITGAQVTATTSGHQGGNPSGFTTCGNIDASDSTYSRWRNYNDVWDNSAGTITEDGVQKMGKMWRRLHWRSPLIAADLKQRKFSKLRIHATEVMIDSYSEFVRKQNDSLGSDGGKFYGAGIGGSGEPYFKGFPLQWAEPLDEASTTQRGAYPLYMIDHGCFFPVIEVDTYFREDTPPRNVSQPDVFTTYVDLAFQFLCGNRQRAGGVISYVAAA